MPGSDASGISRDPDGRWRVCTHAAVSSMLRDRRLEARAVALTTAHGEGGPLARLRAAQMINMNGSDHTRVRGVVARAFSPRAIASLEPAIDARVDSILADLGGRSRVDVVESFAFKVPIAVICDMLGIDADDDLDRIRAWSEAMVRSFDPAIGETQVSAADEAVRQFTAFVRSTIEDRRINPGDDLISAMVRAAAEQGALDDEELTANVILLVTAGFETTMSLIASTIRLLLDDPVRRDGLVADPDSVSGVVEEALRLEGPIVTVVRVAAGALVGTPVDQGDAVVLDLAEASVDPDAFDRSKRFEPDRSPNRHLAFGGGPHLCLGAPLARLEAQIAVERFAARFPHARLAPGGALWRDHPTLRSLAQLEVLLDPTPA